LGTDTGNSIRGPSSHCFLVGIRSTMGLTSRDGIIPLYLRNDIGGPMARTVEDAVKILEVIAGFDPSDPITEKSKDLSPFNYTSFLKKDGLKGARIGVFQYYTEKPTANPQIKELFEKAIDDNKSPAGDNSQLIPPHTGFQAITVPMDFTSDNLPTGLQIVGKLFEERVIIQIAYAYEQATKHRQPPTRFVVTKR